MDKRMRQYLGIVLAVLFYYVVHEGAHLIYALCLGVYKEIKFMGLGIQIDVYDGFMTDMQMGIFCLSGAIATLVCSYILVCATKTVCKKKSKVFRAALYYITIVLLLLDPLYLSFLCGFFGGGDMNGIALLIPEVVTRVGFGLLLIVNGLIIYRMVLPAYTLSFLEKEKSNGTVGKNTKTS